MNNEGLLNPTKKVRKKERTKRVEFELYASFLALATDDKDKIFGFHTDEDYAKKYKVSRTTLSEWKMDDKLWELRDRHMKKFKEYTPNVLKYLYAGMALKKSAPEAMAWFKLVERYVEKNETKHTVDIEEIKRLTEVTNKFLDS